MPKIVYGKVSALGMTIQQTKKLVDEYAHEIKERENERGSIQIHREKEHRE